MIKNTIGASLLAFGLIGATSSQALVVIENFDTFGNGIGAPGTPPWTTGPATFTHLGYTYINGAHSPAQNAPNSLWAEGTITETASSSSVHSLWVPNVTPFQGAGFLAVNGATAPGATVFQRALIPVVGGLNYFFDANLTALFPGVNAGATADLQFTVQYFAAGNVASGAPIVGGVFTPTVVGAWIPTSLGALAPSNAVTATISLRNSEIAPSGNDFGVDYISFDTERQIPGVPEVSTGISAGVFALVGGLVVLRRRKAAQVA